MAWHVKLCMDVMLSDQRVSFELGIGDMLCVMLSDEFVSCSVMRGCCVK